MHAEPMNKSFCIYVAFLSFIAILVFGVFDSILNLFILVQRPGTFTYGFIANRGSFIYFFSKLLITCILISGAYLLAKNYKKIQGICTGLLFSFIAGCFMKSTNDMIIYWRPSFALPETGIIYIWFLSLILFVFGGFLYDFLYVKSINLPKFRRLATHKDIIIIFAILALAICLRLYMIDRTFTGYHSWKEVHYAMEARHFMERGMFFTPEWDYVKSFNDIGYQASTFPITSWCVYAMWKVFGEAEWAARLPIVLISVLTVLITLLIGKELFNKNVGYWAALLIAITPLSVYFGQNVQPDSIMVFFLSLTIYFQIIWAREGANKYLLLSIPCGMFAILAKYPAALVIIPTMIAASMWKFTIKLDNIREYLNPKMWSTFMLWSIVICVPAAVWFIFAKRYGEFIESGYLLNLSTLTNPLFYVQVVGRFTVLVTPVIILIVCTGIILMLLQILRNSRKSNAEYFLIIFFLSTILVQVITSLGALYHSYYQLPIIIPASIFAGWFIANIISEKETFYAFLIVLLVTTTTMPVTLGVFEEDLDIYQAGMYINKHTDKDEKILRMARPPFLYYANRKGISMNETDFEKALERDDVNYLVVAREFDYLSNKWKGDPITKITYIQNNTILEKRIGRFSIYAIAKEKK